MGSNLEEVLSATNKRRVKALRQVMTRYEQDEKLKQVDVAKLLGWTPSYLSQMIGPHPSRPISEKTARQIETKLKLETNLLDKELPATAAFGTPAGALLDQVMLTIDSALRAAGMKLEESKYRGLVNHFYTNALKRGESQVDRGDVDTLLKLMR